MRIPPRIRLSTRPARAALETWWYGRLPVQETRQRWLSQNVVWLGVVSLLTDASSEMIVPLLPAFITGVLGGGALALGWIEGAADAVASVMKRWPVSAACSPACASASSGKPTTAAPRSSPRPPSPRWPPSRCSMCDRHRASDSRCEPGSVTNRPVGAHAASHPASDRVRATRLTTVATLVLPWHMPEVSRDR